MSTNESKEYCSCRNGRKRRARSDLILGDEVYAIIGAGMEVHNEMNYGFLEPVYQEALGLEFSVRGIPFEREKVLRISYKGILLEKVYVADFVCYDSIIVEVKAINKLSGTEESQILNYLKATGMKVGLLINFGTKDKMEWKRFVN